MHIQSEEEAGAVSILAQLRAIRAALREMAGVAGPLGDSPVPLRSIAAPDQSQPIHGGDARVEREYREAP